MSFIPPDASAYRDAISRRTAIASALAVGAGALAGCASSPTRSGAAELPAAAASPATAPARKYNMKKSINLWAFPYPDKWSLRQCLQTAKNAGFDGIELNYDLDSDLSPKSSTKEFQAIRK